MKNIKIKSSCDYEYKRKDGGTIWCYGELKWDSNISVVCDDETLDGIWAERDNYIQKTWHDVCEYLEREYAADIEQLEAC